jgi:hypothetical protein
VVVDAAVKETTKTTLRSGWRGVVKNDLTGPTLLEISDKPTSQELAERFTVGAYWNW